MRAPIVIVAVFLLSGLFFDRAGFQIHDPAKIELGRLLFFDKILSGDYSVSCATCHVHDRASSNGNVLAGADRSSPETDDMALGGLTAYQRLHPSDDHAPVLFNLGHRSVDRLFRDGRVEKDNDGAIVTPAGKFGGSLDSVLAAQALFPAVTNGEQAGNGHGNELELATAKGFEAGWAVLEERVRQLDDYAPHFRAAYGDTGVDRFRIANAVGAFVATEWRADRFGAVGTPLERKGKALFQSRCASCHLPPFGRGEIHEGFQRESAVTPGLVNVARSGPWGPDGQFATLDDLLRVHGGTLLQERAALLAYLATLTDPAALAGRLGPPSAVPSGLALD